MDNIFNLIINAVFSGSVILIPILFIVHLSKAGTGAVNKTTLIEAVNCTLLAGSILYIARFIIQIYTSLFSGGEYEQYTFTNRFFGHYWLDLWVLIIFRYALLPQLLWIGKLRKSIVSSFVIICTWGLSSLAVTILSPPEGWHITLVAPMLDYLISIIIYLVIISLIYKLLNRKRVLNSV